MCIVDVRDMQEIVGFTQRKLNKHTMEKKIAREKEREKTQENSTWFGQTMPTSTPERSFFTIENKTGTRKPWIKSHNPQPSNPLVLTHPIHMKNSHNIFLYH